MVHQKIIDKTARVCVIGLGYVGMPLVMSLVENGFNVVGYDCEQHKIDSINAGNVYLQHIDVDRYKRCVCSDKFHATSECADLMDCDVYLICVPTPLNRYNEPDLSYIRSACCDIRQVIKPGALVVLESTTYPGTTRMLDDEYFHGDCLLAYSPEREDPGNKHYWLGNVPKLVGGIDEESRVVASDFYRQILDIVYEVDSPEIAETAKIFENAFRLVNIAFVNEMKMICERMDIPIADVIRASDTKPFGFKAFWPGPSVGGHCVPLDPHYLNWKAKEFGITSKMIELASDILDHQIPRVINRVFQTLNQMHKTVSGARILTVGVAYKRDVGDVRESPALEIVKALKSHGANVDVYDPHVCSDDVGFMIEKTLTPSMVQNADLVLVLTDHTCVDWDKLAELATCIIDTRNVVEYPDVIRV